MIKVQFIDEISNCLLDEYNDKIIRGFEINMYDNQSKFHKIVVNVKYCNNIFCLRYVVDGNTERQMRVYVQMCDAKDNKIHPVIIGILYYNGQYAYDVKTDYAYAKISEIFEPVTLEKMKEIIIKLPLKPLSIAALLKIRNLQCNNIINMKEPYDVEGSSVKEVLDFIDYINGDFCPIFTTNQYYLVK